MGYKLKNTVSVEWLSNELGLEYREDVDGIISNVAPLNEVGSGSLTFAKASISITQKNVTLIAGNECEHSSIILSDNPRLDFIRALFILDTKIGFDLEYGEKKIHPSVILGENVSIGAGVSIGKNTIIEPNVTILDGAKIGENCHIRANASIGGDGFGYERLEDGTPIKFIHLGSVEIGNNVEIGSCTCIARGTLGNTVIEDGVKIDNLVQIAHNCFIGNGTMIASHAAIGGSVKMGENCWVSTSVCIKNGLKIGDSSFLGIGAVVIRNVKNKKTVFGNPARIIKGLS